jgi:tRNA threonylcarbamoyladenosine biosynthesis protein TsaB
MIYILIIDTSQETATVMLSKDGAIQSLLTNTIQRDHAAFLHVAIQELLAKENIKTTNLEAIAVTNGPGSYTGIRVGMAAAKGLSYALNIPFITIGSLEAMAKDVILTRENTIDCLFCPMIDARRMEVFTALYDDKMNILLEPHAEVLSPQSFAENYDKKMIIYFGSGMGKWRLICSDKNAFFIESEFNPNTLNLLAFERFSNKDFSNITSSTPQYSKSFYTL